MTDLATKAQTSPSKKTVLIIGGGFAGINAAKNLAGLDDVQVILVDRRNHHLFQPLLYQVATAGLNPGDIAVPIRSQFSGVDNVEVHMGEVHSIDLSSKRAVLSGDVEVPFHYLILACGAQHSYFAHPEWEEFAPGLKTLEQATEIRRRILSAFEQAENEVQADRQRALMTFLIVGGGPTGVELAGAIADISRTVLQNDFRRVDPAQARVVLVEAGARVLSSFSEGLSRRAEKDLRELGVEVRLGVRVEKLDQEGASLGAERIVAANVFWAAGVQASAMAFVGGSIQKDRAGRIPVGKDCAMKGYPNIFVIGDMAAFETASGEFLPGLAPVAIQAGKFVARTIRKELKGRPRGQFHYVDKGQMATVGKNRAIVEAGRIRIWGRIAWLAWLLIHIFFLIGFKNRISVMAQWAWSYVFSKRGARLITEKDWKLRH